MTKIIIVLNPGESRPHYMLRVASAFIREHCSAGLITFDEAECDGHCVADDIASAAEELAECEDNHIYEGCDE